MNLNGTKHPLHEESMVFVNNRHRKGLGHFRSQVDPNSAHIEEELMLLFVQLGQLLQMEMHGDVRRLNGRVETNTHNNESI